MLQPLQMSECDRSFRQQPKYELSLGHHQACGLGRVQLCWHQHRGTWCIDCHQRWSRMLYHWLSLQHKHTSLIFPDLLAGLALHVVPYSGLLRPNSKNSFHILWSQRRLPPEGTMERVHFGPQSYADYLSSSLHKLHRRGRRRLRRNRFKAIPHSNLLLTLAWGCLKLLKLGPHCTLG